MFYVYDTNTDSDDNGGMNESARNAEYNVVHFLFLYNWSWSHNQKKKEVELR